MNCVFKNKTRDKSWKQYYEKMSEVANAVKNHCNVREDSIVSIILVKEKKIHEINRDYRGIDRSTDVITFAANEGDLFVAEEYLELGDIFINVDAVTSQAIEYGHSVEREICFLFIHGLLHTLGYDHLSKEDESVMFDLQSKLLDPIVAR